MLNFNLNSKKSVEDLIKLCEKYRDDVEVEVIHGNQIVNGCSLLGVFSLTGISWELKRIAGMKVRYRGLQKNWRE